MSVGTILAGAGRQIGSAIGGIGDRAIQVAIRQEQLRQQEFRNQLELADLMQRQQVSALNLATNVRRLDLAEDQLAQVTTEFEAGAPLRAAELATATQALETEKARAELLRTQAAGEQVQLDLLRTSLKPEGDEKPKREEGLLNVRRPVELSSKLGLLLRLELNEGLGLN